MLPTSLLIWINMRTQTENIPSICQIMGGARPEPHRVNLWHCPFLPPEHLDSFWQENTFLLLAPFQLNTANCGLSLNPRGSGREEGDSQLWPQLLLQSAFALHKGSVLWENNGPCGHLSPFLLLVLNAGEYTQTRKESTHQLTKGACLGWVLIFSLTVLC